MRAVKNAVNYDEDYTPEHETELAGKKKPSKKRKTQDIPDDELQPVPEYLSALERLPSEIRTSIMNNINDSRTILSLLLTSKTMYETLTKGPAIEKQWHRRCSKFGAQKKSPGCKTWRETWVSLLRKRCMSCGRPTTAKFGPLCAAVPHWSSAVPHWTVVCYPCTDREGFYETWTAGDAYAQGAKEEDLARLPFNWRTDDSGHSRYRRKSWYKVYWARGVLKAIAAGKKKRKAAQIAAEEEAARRAQAYRDFVERTIASFKGSQTDLREAVDAVEQQMYPWSPALARLVNAVFTETEPKVKQTELKAIVTYSNKVMSVLDTVCIALVGAGMNGDEHLLPLDGLVEPHKPKARRIWIDSLVKNKVNVEQYIAAAVAAQTP